jgi:hypothetical protein
MQAAAEQKAKLVEAVFVEDDVICPMCESYEVEEWKNQFECCQCGTCWKVLSLER